MEDSTLRKVKGDGFRKITTYPVPFDLERSKENISIFTNAPSKSTKNKIINQAFRLHSKGNILEAAKYYKYLIDQGFNDYSIFANYGVLLKGLGNLKQAEDSLRKAIQIKPDLAESHSNLGGVLRENGKSKEAELSYRKAIELKPDFAIAYYNLGNILNDLGDLKEAELSHRKAIELKPDFADAHFNLSLIELLKGNYQSGLNNYEYRFKKNKPNFPITRLKMKMKENRKFEKGEKLLVIREQGLGDTLQYMRYVPYLKQQGLDISFCAQEKLHTLIRSSGIDENPLTEEQARTISEGQWISLLSLPKYLRISPNNPIICKPYIFSTDEYKRKWKNILSKEKRPIVGINWQGNPKMEGTYKGRSLPLETFSILLEQNNINLLSLQKGFGSDQLESCSFKQKFVGCQSQIDSTWDFCENAAIIDNCNLIITNDTSIAHLAGGMGKKVWLLLRDIPFWTWGLEKDNTFWYPSMRLFRQKERHNWKEVMERVSHEIKEGLS